MSLLSTRIAPIAFGLAVFSLALALRIEAARDELWIDEYITAWTASDSLTDAWQRASISHQAPLYNVLMYGLIRWFGESPWVLRMPSLVAGMLVVVLAACAAHRITGSQVAGCYAGFVAAIDQNYVFYSSEARAYACVQLLGLLAAIIAKNLVYPQCRASRRAGASWGQSIVLAVVFVAMFYLHFTCIAFVAGVIVVGSYCVVRFGQSSAEWWLAVLATALACVPGLWTLAAIGRHADDWMSIGTSIDLRGSLVPFSLIYFLPAILACGVYVSNRSVETELRITLFYLSLIATTVAVIAFLTISELAPLGLYRYWIAATGLGPVVAASLVSAMTNRVSRVAVASALGFFAWLWTPVGHDLDRGTLQRPLRFEHWTTIAETIDQQADGRLVPLIVLPNLIEDHRIPSLPTDLERAYFWAPFDVLGRPKCVSEILATPTWSPPRLDESLRQRLDSTRAAWLVIRGGPDLNLPRGGPVLESLMAELNTDPQDTNWSVARLGPSNSDVQLFRLSRE